MPSARSVVVLLDKSATGLLAVKSAKTRLTFLTTSPKRVVTVPSASPAFGASTASFTILPITVASSSSCATVISS